MKNENLTNLKVTLENIWHSHYWQRIIANSVALIFIISTGITVFNTGSILIRSTIVVSFADIPQWHLFGEAPPSISLASKTDLQLTLVGILTATPTQAAQVIIATPDGAQKTYSVGQQLPGDAVLYRILPNSIIILHNGQLEELSMVTWSETNQTNSATNTTTDNSGTDNTPPTINNTPPVSPFNFLSPEIRRRLPAGFLRNYY
jgi:type II secretory pathway component PulC